MSSKHHARCERWSDEPLPGGRSNALPIQHLGWHHSLYGVHGSGNITQPLVFPPASVEVAARYTAGPSAFH
jgi:hypothetical protein